MQKHRRDNAREITREEKGESQTEGRETDGAGGRKTQTGREIQGERRGGETYTAALKGQCEGDKHRKRR
jgi:hypothetical protein